MNIVVVPPAPYFISSQPMVRAILPAAVRCRSSRKAANAAVKIVVAGQDQMEAGHGLYVFVWERMLTKNLTILILLPLPNNFVTLILY